MPKVKTNSGAKKRFRFTGTGKIKIASPGGSAKEYDKENKEAKEKLGTLNAS